MADGTLIPGLFPSGGTPDMAAMRPATEVLPYDVTLGWQKTFPSLGAPYIVASRPAGAVLNISPYTMQESGGSRVTMYFQMRGYRYTHVPTPDFETWTAVGSPDTNNPSGEPIQDVIVQSSWSV